MCPPVFIFNNQYVNPNGDQNNSHSTAKARQLLKEVLLRWVESHAKIFAILEEEWVDEEAQVAELLRLKYEAEEIHALLKNDIKP
ncbi:hypothetical protein ACFSKL_09495 [Belliella marina]|uniref:Uncharacterized protein n=1 Tax=Belliella marina TaxID=1644146 RepID=A0ABW4VQJ8_9BACT